MANEGIMALPEGMPMQGEEPVSEQPTVSSADSYDAAQTALGMVSPGEDVAIKEAIRQNIGDLQLTPEQLDMMIQVFEYISQRPEDYGNMLKLMQEQGAIDPGDLPEEYDPVFIGTMLAVLHEMQQMQGEGAQDPMAMSPVVEGLQPIAMAQGGLADVGQYLASRGRGGDSILAHITPEEASMLKSRGGAGTVNPNTGLPEFKSNPFKAIGKAISSVVKGVVNVVKKVIASPIGKVVSTIALATVLGPAGVGLSMGTAAGVAGAGTTLLGGGSLKEALISGALGYVGGGGTIMGVSPTGALGQYLPGAAGGALNTGLATGLIGTGIGKLGGMSTSDALKMGLTSGASAAALAGLNGGSQGNAQPQADGGGGAEASGGGGGSDSGLQYDGTARSMLSMQPTQSMQPMSYNTPNSAASSSPGFFESMLGSSTPAATSSAAAAPAASSPGFFESLFGPSAAPGTAAASLGAAAPSAATTAAAAAPGMGLMTKIGLGLGVSALAGGFKQPKADLDPVSKAEQERYLESVRLGQERDKFIKEGGYGLGTSQFTPYNPIVSTDYTATLPMQTAPSVVRPTGITNSTGVVAQPYNLAGMYGVPQVYGQGTPQRLAKGGIPEPTDFPRKNGPINGPGTGTSDDIPAMLSDGEFVFTAKAVRNAGSGSRRKGAARMYKLMKMLEGGPVKGK